MRFYGQLQGEYRQDNGPTTKDGKLRSSHRRKARRAAKKRIRARSRQDLLKTPWIDITRT